MGSTSKPDFSNVQSGSTTTAPPAPKPPAPDFSNVQAGSTSTAAVEPTTYTVVSGDSLSKIAKRFFGHANRWHEIFDANRDQISNPDMIRVGQVLKIPNIDKQKDTHA
jgi:nucleoid-associated protein YgaU